MDVALRGAHMYLGRNICPHVPHNTSRVCGTRVRANSRDWNSSHVHVINAITYKLWRELEPHSDLYRGFSLPSLSFSLPTPHLFLPLKDHWGAMASSGLVKLSVCSRIVKVLRITGNPRRFMRVVNKKKREEAKDEGSSKRRRKTALSSDKLVPGNFKSSRL